MLLEIENLHKEFPLEKSLFGKPKQFVHALNGVSFQVLKNQTVGLAGESGSGKSTLAKIILGLVPASAGKIKFEGQDLLIQNSKGEMNYKLIDRRQIQMVFQDPFSSLNPKLTIESILKEPLEINSLNSPIQNREKVLEILEKVGLSEDILQKYPHQFSGGQRQRISIARALLLNPSLLICDEPVSALDVSIQAQILNLLKTIKSQQNFSMLFISHDLRVLHYLSDILVVLYLGFVLEIVPAERLEEAKHPYTWQLLKALPEIGKKLERQTQQSLAELPSAVNLPQGCPFYARCLDKTKDCAEKRPVLKTVADQHQVACFLYD